MSAPSLFEHSSDVVNKTGLCGESIKYVTNDDDDVGRNVLRCRADILGKNVTNQPVSAFQL